MTIVEEKFIVSFSFCSFFGKLQLQLSAHTISQDREDFGPGTSVCHCIHSRKDRGLALQVLSVMRMVHMCADIPNGSYL